MHHCHSLNTVMQMSMLYEYEVIQSISRLSVLKTQVWDLAVQTVGLQQGIYPGYSLVKV